MVGGREREGPTFDKDEGQLQPERAAQDTVLAEMYTQPLVFRAYEDGADDVSGSICASVRLDEKRSFESSLLT